MITIHPQYLTLSKLLDGRLFHIPEYQRAYSWTSRERQDREARLIEWAAEEWAD